MRGEQAPQGGQPMKVSVFGAGYVGLTTACCFAEMGNSVVCMDIDADRVAALRAGQVPIHEPGMERLAHRNVAAGCLAFTADAAQAVAHGDILFIAVGTPAEADGSADLGPTLRVARQVAQQMQAPKIIVNKSTVPVGTAYKMRRLMAATLAERGADIDFDVVSNPEFLKEGSAINDFMRPDRIIIGTSSVASRAQLERLYEPFVRNHDKFVHMNERSAELAKYAANAMLAARISLMNELANLADELGADIEAVRHSLGRDPRIGTHFLYPGAGYGGACFPKDLKALIHMAGEAGLDVELLPAVERVNRRQKGLLLRKMRSHYQNDLAGKTFALWGLAFKANTDDMREAPSLVVIDGLLAAGAAVNAYDPAAGPEARRRYGDRINICQRRDDALAGAHGLIVITEWNEFRTPDFEKVYNKLKNKAIFDGRNLYNGDELRSLGFSYYAVGRSQDGFGAAGN